VAILDDLHHPDADTVRAQLAPGRRAASSRPGQQKQKFHYSERTVVKALGLRNAFTVAVQLTGAVHCNKFQ